MKSLNLMYLLMVSSLTLASCVSDKSTFSENTGPLEDDQYAAVYQDHTRQQDVFINFETRYSVSATYLSPDFRSAFAARFEDLFNSPQPILEEASNKAGFFLTLYSPVDDGYNLADDQLWNIQLRTDEGTLKPLLVKRLHNKSRWQPFFTHVHRWSREYLILFDTPARTINSKLKSQPQWQMLLANAEAKVTLDW